VSTDPYADFTEAAYLEVLTAAASRFRFEAFGTECREPHVLWRHDVDISVHRAARLAQLEVDAGVRATYFLMFHSTFYNLLERPVLDRARSIAARGHDVGLHFDSAFYDDVDSRDALEERLRSEAALLGDLLEVPIRAFSFHNPGNVNDDLASDDDVIAGLVNTYGRTLRLRYRYVSDSNGYWRHDRLLDVIVSGDDERLHVLTHPGWWQAEAMPPRKRILRCVDGRAERTLLDYDELLARAGRLNVG